MQEQVTLHLIGLLILKRVFSLGHLTCGRQLVTLEGDLFQVRLCTRQGNYAAAGV